MKQSRRKFLRYTGLPLLGTACFPALAAENSSTKFELRTVHEQAAQQARLLSEGRNVNLKILYPNGALGNVAPVADLFYKMSGIIVSPVEIPLNDINTYVILSAAARNADFDLALPATFGLPDLVEASALENLSEFAARYEPVDFRDNALYSIGDYYKGNLYGYQTDGDTYLMFYNKAWLEDEEERRRYRELHGRELEVPGTWEELDRAIEFFHRPDKGMYGGSLFRNPGFLAWEFWMRFHAKGFFPFDDEMNTRIDNESGIRALEEMIAVSSFLEPDVYTNSLFENMKSFAEGNKFCNIGWGGSQKAFNDPSSKIKGNMLFSPAPGGVVNGRPIQTAFFNWGWNYTVSSQSKEKEIAYLFALFADSPVVSTIAVRDASGYFDPFRTEHYRDPEIVKTYSHEFLAAHEKSMSTSIPDLYLKGQGEYFGVLKENLTRAFQGKTTAKRALGRTAKQWKKITRKMNLESQIEQWRFVKSSYPENLRDVLS